MARSRAEFFRTGVAECYAASRLAKDPAIKQAYLELARAWQALADEIEHLRLQIRRPKIYSGNALPHRSLDDFYELRPAGSDPRGRKHAVEHPALGGQDNPAATGRDVPLPRPQSRRTRRRSSL